jgi:hypothetical protein
MNCRLRNIPNHLLQTLINGGVSKILLFNNMNEVHSTHGVYALPSHNSLAHGEAPSGPNRQCKTRVYTV